MNGSRNVVNRKSIFNSEAATPLSNCFLASKANQAAKNEVMRRFKTLFTATSKGCSIEVQEAGT
jgi:hypothetical protein